MKNENIVFFIGAGFSYDADMPLMKEFGKYSNKEFKNIKYHAFCDYRFAAPLIYQAGLNYYAYKEYLKNIDNEFDMNNLEILFQKVEEIKNDEVILNIPNVPQNVPLTVSKTELIKSLQFWTWNIYKRLPIIDANVVSMYREPNKRIYAEFSVLLQKFNNIKQFDIITTNYDLVIEYSFWKASLKNAGKKVCYPFEFTKIPLTTNENEIIEGCHSENSIRLFKIHGSANFYIKPYMTDELFVSTDISPSPIGYSDMQNQPVSIYLDALYALRQKYGSDLVPEIIAPMNKNYHADMPQWQRQIMDKAQDAMENADKVIFIGYSLPDADKSMKTWLNKHTNSEAEIVVIDPCSEVRRRFDTVFSEWNMTFIRATFADSLCYIEPILSR